MLEKDKGGERVQRPRANGKRRQKEGMEGASWGRLRLIGCRRKRSSSSRQRFLCSFVVCYLLRGVFYLDVVIVCVFAEWTMLLSIAVCQLLNIVMHGVCISITVVCSCQLTIY